MRVPVLALTLILSAITLIAATLTSFVLALFYRPDPPRPKPASRDDIEVKQIVCFIKQHSSPPKEIVVYRKESA